jgi:signal peptidase
LVERLASWAVIGAVASLALAVTLPPLFGYQVLTVLTGSMQPTIGVGAVVVDELISPLDASIGDIVTFSDPDRRGRLITHRLQDVRVRGRRAYMVTKGDANDSVERWSVPVDGKVGRVAYQVPKLGYVREWFAGRGGRIALAIVVVCLGIWVLVDLWGPQKRDAELG